MDDFDDMICLEEKIHLLHTVFTAKVLMDGLMEELADVKERLRDDLD